jgi:hypothetical protein
MSPQHSSGYHSWALAALALERPDRPAPVLFICNSRGSVWTMRCGSGHQSPNEERLVARRVVRSVLSYAQVPTIWLGGVIFDQWK